MSKMESAEDPFAPVGPVDTSVARMPVLDVGRPAWFTLMAPGWMPPVAEVTQTLGICFTDDRQVVLVTWDGQEWTFPGGSVESGETLEETLIREVAEEACATVTASRYLACQHIADPLNTFGATSFYQTRWWARVTLDPWQPEHEMVDRRLVPPERVLETLCWTEKEIAGRLLEQALDADSRYRLSDRSI
jgi:8-oxo-dGTP pyrophosphatase MutT (NUDIX family)